MARKRALVIGINSYHPRIGRLYGCINDARHVRQLLSTRFFFQNGDIRYLEDQEATREAILEGLTWLISASQAGDVCVFFYAGHGTRLQNPEDPSGKDETLIAFSPRWEELLAGKTNADIIFERQYWAVQFIRDKEIKSCLAPLAEGVNLTLIVDCCHSGDINKLAGDEAPRFVEPPLEIQKAITAAQRTFWQRIKSVFSPVPAVQPKVFGGNRFDFVGTDENNTLLAACSEVQTAAENHFDGIAEGVFTHYLVGIFDSSSTTLTHEDLIWKLGNEMRFVAQTPRLTCPTNLGTHAVFAPLI